MIKVFAGVLVLFGRDWIILKGIGLYKVGINYFIEGCFFREFINRR